MNEEIFKKVDKYIDDLFAQEDEALTSTIKSIEDANMPQHSVSPNQGKFLQVMARLCQAKNILEIGTLGAYSTTWLARVLPADGKLITIELNPAYAELAKKNIERSKLSEKVEFKVGEALSVLKEINGSYTFDMIFIDAHKPSYIEYFEWALENSHSGTLIIADNVIREGQVLDLNTKDEKVLGVQSFNKMIANNSRVMSTIIPTVGNKGYDGMAISVVI